MSDIPIGSPPAPPGRHAAPSGWYADPTDPSQERWWDGWQWSRNTRPREGVEPAAADAAGAPAGSPPSPAYPPYPAGAPPYGYPPAQPYGYPPVPPSGYPPVAYQSRLPVTADGVPLAGWWQRVLAVVVDSILVSLVAGLLSSPLLVRIGGRLVEIFNEAVRTGGNPLLTGLQVLTPAETALLTLIQLSVAAAYHAIFLRTKAATPGKLVVGLRVVPVDQGRNRAPLGWGTIVVRILVWLGPMASAVLIAVRLVDVLIPLWQPKRQALHDLAAKTQVVRVR